MGCGGGHPRTKVSVGDPHVGLSAQGCPEGVGGGWAHGGSRAWAEGPSYNLVPSLFHPRPTCQTHLPCHQARTGLSLGTPKPQSAPRRHAASGR